MDLQQVASTVLTKKINKRKSCSVNWSREMILKLIEVYESHSNLWDCSLEEYKNRNSRKTSLDAISNAMKISAQEVNDKIHSLRCQFQSINRKCKKTRSGQAAGENLIVKWEFFDALKFIDLPKTGINEKTIDSLTSQDIIHDESLSEDQVSNLSNSRCHTPSVSACTPSSAKTPNATPALSMTKKKKKDQDQQALLDQCLGVMSKTADSFEIFGDYVADELRNMHIKDPALQRRAKLDIQRIILNMNDSYESRLQNNISSQQQIPNNKDSAVHYSTYNLPLAPTVSNEQIENDTGNQNNNVNLVQFYEDCESTLLTL